MKRTLRGILAMGTTKAGAVNNYRLLALGKGATMQVDEGGTNAFVVQASVADILFNPLSGDMDLVPRPKLLQSVQFQSESSTGNLEAHYAHCANGCGQHIIAESAEVLKYCPNCTCALSSGNGEADGLGSQQLVSASDDDVANEDEPDSSDDQDDLAELDATDSEPEDEESSESSSSIRRRIRRVRRASQSNSEGSSDDESSEEEPEDADEDEIVPAEADEEVSASSADELESDELEGDTVSSDDGNSASDEDAIVEEEADESSESSEPLVVVASTAQEAVSIYRKERTQVSTSSARGESKAVHCLVCSSCSGHVVADVELDECPSCHSALCEPDVAQAAEFEQASIDNLDGTDLSGEPQLQSENEDAGDCSDDETDEEDESSESGEELVSDSGDDVTDDSSEDSSEEDSSEDGEASDESEDAGTDLALTDDSGDGLDGSDDSEIAVMNTVSESASVDNLDVSYSSRVGKEAAWTAYVEGRPVAMVSKSGSGKNEDIFDSPKFGAALLATAKVAGVKKALAELGFKSLSARFSKSAEIKRRVEAAVASEKAALASKEADSNKRLEAALATAAIGLNRGFFQGKSSPIKEGLFNAMSAGGLRNPERIIDNVFAHHHDTYLKQLFAQAGEILKMEPQVQDSLSKTILSVSYQSASSGEDREEGLESRLAGMGTSVSSSGEPAAPQRTAPPEAREQSGRVQIKAAVSGLGRRHTIGR